MSTLLATIGPFIAPGVLTLIAGTGVAVAYGKIKNSVTTIKEDLYPDGRPKYLSKEVYATAQTTLNVTLKRLDKKIDEMDEKRETARGEINKELKAIAHFMGRVEQYMVDHNEGG